MSHESLDEWLFLPQLRARKIRSQHHLNCWPRRELILPTTVPSATPIMEAGIRRCGQNLYPKPPDMRLPQTQHLTDGEIYYSIQNGIRLTGMPAWGTEVRDDDSRKLVLFIRHLPQLTPVEEREMESLNPKGQHERQEEQGQEEFLNGESGGQVPNNLHTDNPKRRNNETRNT